LVLSHLSYIPSGEVARIWHFIDVYYFAQWKRQVSEIDTPKEWMSFDEYYFLQFAGVDSPKNTPSAVFANLLILCLTNQMEWTKIENLGIISTIVENIDSFALSNVIEEVERQDDRIRMLRIMTGKKSFKEFCFSLLSFNAPLDKGEQKSGEDYFRIAAGKAIASSIVRSLVSFGWSTEFLSSDFNVAYQLSDPS
jgi:hypothetical protein